MLADVADRDLLNGVQALAPTRDEEDEDGLAEEEDGLTEMVPDRRCKRLAIGTLSSSSLSPTISISSLLWKSLIAIGRAAVRVEFALRGFLASLNLSRDRFSSMETVSF